MNVACLLVPNFAVALARRDDPQLAKRPIIIGGSPEEHSAVTACSEEAAAAGVSIGTTLRRALALCPEAVFLPNRQGDITAAATQMVELCKLYSPIVEAVAPGHVHFEIRGLAALARMSVDTWLSDLWIAAGDSSGLPVALSAAETVFAAHAANFTRLLEDQARLNGQNARGPILIEAGKTAAFLARLPVEVLPAGAAMHQRLRLFGLERLGQVAALPLSALQAQFGREGARAWELARGQDDGRIVPGIETVVLVEDTDLPGPTALSEPLVVGTHTIVQRALERKEAKGRSIRRMDWRVGLESGEELTRRTVFREPTADAGRMLFALRGKIERLRLPSAAISIGVTLSGLCSEYGHQANLWQVGPRRWKELTESIEQLHMRTGGTQVFRIVDIQPWSRLPERQLGLVAFAG